ncbi:hypothetical protein HanHA89_Chr01g0032501 [Helianthus annuus]|nr:hypothetical protein HanHA89_Chr01g0032501 [Helianthus annuus]
MAIARTGVFVDDYLEYASTLPAELQRLLNTIRELDDRSQLYELESINLGPPIGRASSGQQWMGRVGSRCFMSVGWVETFPADNGTVGRIVAGGGGAGWVGARRF